MRFTPTALLAFSTLALAEEQAPLFDKLKGYFNKATAAVASNVPSALPHPIDAGAAKVASSVVQQLHLSNWQDVLTPDASAKGQGAEEWMVYFTGGNKTCFGACDNADKAFNVRQTKKVIRQALLTETFQLASAMLTASSNTPKLAMADCETEGVLCDLLAVNPPSIYHMLLPQPLADQSKPATTVRYISLNHTEVTSKQIAEIHTKETYKEVTPYEGFFHPFDSIIAKTGLNVPLGYVIYGFSKMPSWLPMILVSFVSRTIM